MTDHRHSLSSQGTEHTPAARQLLRYLLEDLEQRDAAGVGAVDDALRVLQAEAHHCWVDHCGGDAAGTSGRSRQHLCSPKHSTHLTVPTQRPKGRPRNGAGSNLRSQAHPTAPSPVALHSPHRKDIGWPLLPLPKARKMSPTTPSGISHMQDYDTPLPEPFCSQASQSRALGWGGPVPHLLRQWLLPAVLVEVGEQVDLGAIVLPQRYLQPSVVMAHPVLCSCQGHQSHPALAQGMQSSPLPFREQALVPPCGPPGPLQHRCPRCAACHPVLLLPAASPASWPVSSGQQGHPPAHALAAASPLQGQLG